MGMFGTFKSLASPRHAEFTKRLIAKRKQLSENALLAGLATSGTAMNHLRRAGLEAVEYAVTPEATIVRILEQYWDLQAFWSQSTIGRHASEEERANDAEKRMSSLLGQIEYRLTKRPDAAVYVPEKLDLAGYIKYRMLVEHPTNPYSADASVGDALIRYAIDEAPLVFCR